MKADMDLLKLYRHLISIHCRVYFIMEIIRH